VDPTFKEKPKARKYFCPNPNCNTLFSRPKIIKYTVCPTCQTLVDDTNIAEHGEIVVALKKRKVAVTGKSKTIKQTGFLEIGAGKNLETRNDQIRFEAPPVPSEQEKTETNKKAVDLEPIPPSQVETAEITPPPQQTTAVDTEKLPELKTGGQFCFGYLSHRKSGEKIPNTCVECSESLNCLLAEYHKSDKSVEEISKWYQ
jgi:hypothetical protein